MLELNKQPRKITYRDLVIDTDELGEAMFVAKGIFDEEGLLYDHEGLLMAGAQLIINARTGDALTQMKWPQAEKILRQVTVKIL